LDKLKALAATRIIASLAGLALWAKLANAQSPDNSRGYPDEVQEFQGQYPAGRTVTCGTGSTLISTGNSWNSITFRSKNTTNTVYVCLTRYLGEGQNPSTCSASAAFAMLDASLPAYTADRALYRVGFTCIASSSTDIVIHEEK
jgi:hypothetical protein